MCHDDDELGTNQLAHRHQKGNHPNDYDEMSHSLG